VGSAVVVSFLTTAAGLGSLVFAGHPVLRAVGINATIGLFTGLAAVLMLIPWAWDKK
jgi:predicted RND superfamily exporter protein